MLRTTFTPRSLAGLAGWWDASVQSSVTLNGSTVSAWADLSGNGRNATQGTASLQPTYSNTRNSLKVLTFDGSTQFLRGPWQITLTGQTTFAVASMLNQSGASSFGRLFTQTTTTDGTPTGSPNDDYGISGHYIPLIRNSTAAAFMSWRASSARAAVNVTYGNWNVWSSTYSSSVISNAIDNETPATFTGSALSTNFHTFGIGRGLASFLTDGCFPGLIGEVIVYSRALSSSEAAAVAAYLRRKWATP